MFRKVAIALLAASVFTAPALAEIAAPAKAPQSTTGSAPAHSANTVKTVKADKAATKRHVVARHHRHGTKMAMHKHVKHVKVAHHGKRGKIAGAGKTAVVKHAAVKPAVTTTGAAVNSAPAQVTAKPAAKSGVN